ncbi:choline kinase [Methylopila jiangsuensis]|uniref:Choline kinase n=1 Tax=Methylopila jiangsuensis TaxID=586230 RepID=A0A9W6JCB3_9HYPH|nr:choline kinase family protein [Methylopila jiangsuensis]MDR6287316.1 thiamine kinase-like enzyme [Methylopila jiangsuensis]GLK74896.1 choline kinase [Methylopila jiangsuensis]
MTEGAALDRVRGLAFWRGPVDPQPLGGGITNANFVVEDAGRKYVVRLGDDIPLHNVMRFNELAASKAAEEAGVSPAVRHAEPGLIVIDHIDGRTFGEADVRAELPRVAALIRTAHREVTRRIHGPALGFWTFHILRSYLQALRDGGCRLTADLPAYAALAERLETALGPTEIVYGHNDLLPGNFLDDGARLWLIDWDYGGFNTPLFDLGNLASNNGFDAGQRDALLEIYYGRAPDDALRLRLQAMEAASLLREALWSLVSEIHSRIDFDYRAYTAENLARLARAVARFDEMAG